MTTFDKLREACERTLEQVQRGGPESVDWATVAALVHPAIQSLSPSRRDALLASPWWKEFATHIAPYLKRAGLLDRPTPEPLTDAEIAELDGADAECPHATERVPVTVLGVEMDSRSVALTVNCQRCGARGVFLIEPDDLVESDACDWDDE